MTKDKFLKISLILICIILGTSFAIPKQTPIPANKDWTNTEYDIKIGDKIEIITAGEISINGTINCDANGISNKPELQNKGLIKTSNYGCLVGKIGEKGKPFLVGKNCTMISDMIGKLYLGINDTALKTNVGEFLSIITITSMTNDNQVSK